MNTIDEARRATEKAQRAANRLLVMADVVYRMLLVKLRIKQRY